MVFHIPKAKTSRFGLNTLRYDGADLSNKFYHALLYKETNLTKAKLKKILQMYFLGMLNFSAHFRLFFFIFFFFSILLQSKYDHLNEI